MFLDNASTTRMNEECLNILKEYNLNCFYNPSAMYKSAFDVSVKINQARESILQLIGAKSCDNFIFTSGATEANNMVINSAKRNKKGRFLFSIGEHPSVYNCALNLQNEGYDVQFVGLNKAGTVDIDDFKRKLTENVCFVSVMHVNNETGAINPIKELVALAKQKNKNLLFHSDGVQALGKIPVNVADLGVDFYTISGHKLHAPKGVGGIYVRKGVYIRPLLLGGGQEKTLRSGTENVAGIVALECAINLAVKNVNDSYNKISAINNAIRMAFFDFDGCEIISADGASPYILSLSFKNTRAETILHMLDEQGYIIGTGSACSSKKKDNRILKAMGYNTNTIEGALRISFSTENANDDIQSFISALKNTVNNYKGSVN